MRCAAAGRASLRRRRSCWSHAFDKQAQGASATECQGRPPDGPIAISCKRGPDQGWVVAAGAGAVLNPAGRVRDAEKQVEFPAGLSCPGYLDEGGSEANRDAMRRSARRGNGGQLSQGHRDGGDRPAHRLPYRSRSASMSARQDAGRWRWARRWAAKGAPVRPAAGPLLPVADRSQTGPDKMIGKPFRPPGLQFRVNACHAIEAPNTQAPAASPPAGCRVAGSGRMLRVEDYLPKTCGV